MSALLGYGEPQILEVFKNTLPNKLYWVLFPMEDLRQVVDIANRFLTEEKIDRQLSSQSATSTPFMMVSDGYKSSNKKAVPFNTSEKNDKIDKLTSLVIKMKVQMDKPDTQYKTQIYQSKRRGQNRCNYTQNDYQQDIGHLVEIEIHHTEAEEILVEIFRQN